MSSKAAFAAAGSSHDLLRVFSDLGTVCLISQDYEAARSYSEESLSLWKALSSTDSLNNELDTYGAAGAFSTLGELETREGNPGEAFYNLQRSLDLFYRLELLNPTYGYYVVDVCASIGRLYTSTGDHVRGLAFLNRALAISKTLDQPNLRAALLNDLGYLYVEQEDYLQAWSKFQESLQLHRVGKNRREESRSLLNLGVVQQRQHKYEAALPLFQASLELAKATNNFEVQIAAGEGIGVVLAAKRDYPAARQILNNSLQLAVERKERVRESELHWRIAEVNLGTGDFNAALIDAQASLKTATLMKSPKLTYLSLDIIGQIYAVQNKTDLAIETLKQAIASVESMRRQVAGDEIERQLFFQDKVSSYHRLIALLLNQNRLSEALLFAERAKGRVLLDVFRSVDAWPNQTSKDLITTRVSGPSQESPKINNLRNQQTFVIGQHVKLNEAIREDQTFRNAIYAVHPDLNVRLGRTAVINESDLARFNLRPGTALLEYVVAKEAIDLFLLRASANHNPVLKSFRIKVSVDSLRQLINLFNRRLAIRHPDFQSLSRELYKVLIEPVHADLNGIRAICIVPDDFLWNLPFQALSNDSSYLLEDYAVSYAPSLSVLIEMGNNFKHDRTPALAAFGNPRLTKYQQLTEQLDPLPETAAEVRSISKLFLVNKNSVLIGRQATEESFNRLAGSVSMLHFATHAFVDNRQPLYSHLLLTRTNDDRATDGRLEAREVLKLNLAADLAVLSACQTANGKVSPGEGILGLSWAFFVAGVRSLV
ncbi:MAG TPA: CHAT domain-containing protein, partial [Pyrinomonadaceae bacterium]